MSDLIAHAKRELRQLPGARSSERKMLEANVLALVAVFQSQEHSGASARFVIDCLDKLLRWQSLTSAAGHSAPTPDLEEHKADAERLTWLEDQARKSRSGISFDWVPSLEGSPSGFRFMRRFFIGEQHKTLRAAIDWAMRNNPNHSSDRAMISAPTPDLGAQGEPVAWAWDHHNGFGCSIVVYGTEKPPESPFTRNIRPLYAHPSVAAEVVAPPALEDVLDHFAVSYRQRTEVLGEFIERYPEHTTDLVDYAHELNLLHARDGDDDREITVTEEERVEEEVALMSMVRKTPIVLVCTVCSERCSADPSEYERRKVAFCACGQLAIPQDEPYFSRRNARALAAAPTPTAAPRKGPSEEEIARVAWENFGPRYGGGPYQDGGPVNWCYRDQRPGDLARINAFARAIMALFADRGETRGEETQAALVEIEQLLTNLQPHIPQACYPGHEGFIDNYVGPALKIARAALSPHRAAPDQGGTEGGR